MIEINYVLLIMRHKVEGKAHCATYKKKLSAVTKEFGVSL